MIKMSESWQQLFLYKNLTVIIAISIENYLINNDIFFRLKFIILS